jgi:hypothetical protein
LRVGAVGVGKKGSGEQAGDHPREAGIDPALLHPGAVILEILADRADQVAGLAQQGQGVGDIGRGAAALAHHRVDQEREADLFQVFGQDVVFEEAWEGHQVVIGDGTGTNDRHESFLIGQD